jgi:titin
VTHGFDQNQAFAVLGFTIGAGTLSVTAPSTSILAPAGYYMMFIINASGVPSVAKMVRLGTSSTPGPTPTSTPSPSASGGTAPAAPSTLTGASPQGSRRVNLAWTDNSGNETGFSIERSSNGTNFTQIGTVAANTRSYTDLNLPAKTQFWYRVKAINASGASAPSNTVSVRVR